MKSLIQTVKTGLVCLSLVLIFGCATADKNLYKTQQASYHTVDAALKVYQDAVKEGYISYNTVELAQKALDTYKDASRALIKAGQELTLQKHLVKDGLAASESLHSAEANVALAFRVFSAAEGDLLALLNRYINNKR